MLNTGDVTLKEVKTMKSQNHRAAFYLCVSILLFVFALISVIPISAQSGGGLNVLSLSRADFGSDDKFLGNAWKLHITQSSSGEQIYGIVDKEAIIGKDPISGEQGFATHDIEISMRTLGTTCNYRIEPKTDTIYPHIYTASVYTEECFFDVLKLGTRCYWYGNKITEDEWRNNCWTDGGDFRKNNMGWLDEKPVLACFKTMDMGTHGVLQTPTYDFATEVIVTKKGDGGGTISAVISNRELETPVGTATKSTYLGDFGYIEWVGNLASGESCTVLDLPDATYNPASGWTLTDKSGYSQYSSHYPTQWDECKHIFETVEFQDSSFAKNHVESCVKTLNDVATKALTPKAIIDPVVLTATTIDNYNVDGAIFKADVKPGAIQSATYMLKLSASWLGIYVPKPEPSIANKQSGWDAATSRGKFRADIKNVGDEGGDFTYGVTCQYPAQAVEPERSGYWNRGETKTVEFLITGSVPEKTITTCTLHVYATKFPDIRKEEAVQITVEPLPTPTPKPTPITTPISTLPGTIIPTSTPDNGDGTPLPFRNMLLYAILGLLFTSVIVAALLWRRGRRGSGTEVSKPSESDESESDTKKRRPSSSSAKWIAGIIILILILGGGLFVVTSLKQPEVSLKSLSVKGFESVNLLIVEIPTEVIFSVVLEVYNPNFLGATVTDVEYDLYVNDVYVGKGSLPRSVTIPANGKTNVETEVSVSISSSIQALIATIQQGSATAKVNGNVYIGVPIRGSISVPFSEEQRLV